MKIVIVILILLTYVIQINCNKCHSCRKYLKYNTCPSLKDKNCEIVRTDCGCCDECALNRGDKCTSKKPRCASGLMCINEHGEALKVIPHSMRNYIGVCESVVVSPVVIENTDVTERRIRI